MPNDKKVFFLITVLIFSTLSITTFGSIFSYYPVKINIMQVPPPITVYVINTNGSVGANNTSATINVTTASSSVLLVSNPGFDNSMNYWSYSTNDGKLAATWVSSDGVANGLVKVYNNTAVTQITDSYLQLYQNFTVFETVSSVNYNVSYRLANTPFKYYTYLYIGIYDYSSGSYTWFVNKQSVSTSSTYSSAIGQYSITLSPGKTYAFVVRVELQQVNIAKPQNFVFYIDYASLTYNPSEVFNNNILGMKVASGSGNYTMQFAITSITGGSNINCNLTLYDSYGSDTISIVNGTPNKYQTSWINITYGGNSQNFDGYLQASVIVNTPGSTLTINGFLVYMPYNGGVSVQYPITINITG